MHAESYRVPQATIDACRNTRATGGRVVAVGTTAVRALESTAATGALEGRANLYIRRPYEWQVVDLLLTNFHLPRSSLLVMIDAFVGERWRDLYAATLDDGYRFLSFGDAMLLRRGSSRSTGVQLGESVSASHVAGTTDGGRGIVGLPACSRAAGTFHRVTAT